MEGRITNNAAGVQSTGRIRQNLFIPEKMISPLDKHDVSTNCDEDQTDYHDEDAQNPYAFFHNHSPLP